MTNDKYLEKYRPRIQQAKSFDELGSIFYEMIAEMIADWIKEKLSEMMKTGEFKIPTEKINEIY